VIINSTRVSTHCKWWVNTISCCVSPGGAIPPAASRPLIGGHNMGFLPEQMWSADLRKSAEIFVLFRTSNKVSTRVRKSAEISVLFRSNFVFREIPRDLTVDYHPLWPIQRGYRGCRFLFFNINTRGLTPLNGPLYPICDGFMAKRGNLKPSTLFLLINNIKRNRVDGFTR